MPVDPDEFFAELEREGEDQVQKKVASNRVYDAYKKSLAEEWLRREAEKRADVLNREQLAIAREAANAARDSADAARDAADEARTANRLARQANTIAKIAIVIAAAASIVSIIATFAS